MSSMPQHVHILFVPRDPDYRIRRILQSVKQPVMRRAINFLRAYPSRVPRAACLPVHWRTSRQWHPKSDLVG